jgi:hypothetical protein
VLSLDLKTSGMAQVVESLPSKRETFNSNPSATKKKKRFENIRKNIQHTKKIT